MLYQEEGILGYFSKKFTNTEKELIGIVKSVLFFKDIIQGYYVEIYTDNRNCGYEIKKL